LHTVRFFFNNKNAIQGREQEAFRVMHPHFVASPTFAVGRRFSGETALEES